MWRSLKKLVLNLLLLGSLVFALPGWHGETAASASTNKPSTRADAGAYDTQSPSSITTTTAFKSAFTLKGRVTVLVTFTTDTALTMAFSLTGLQPGWTGGLFTANGDPVPVSGVSVPAGSYTVFVRITADPTVLEGKSTDAVLQATQVGNPANTATVNLRFAVPSPFVYVMSDALELLRLAYLSPDATTEVPELLTTGGNNLAVSAALLNHNKYILGYENKLIGFDSQNVEFSIFNNVGGVLAHRVKPFDHQNENFKTTDSKPAFAASPTGKFGMAFIREAPGPNYSILFQLFSEDGTKVAGAPSPVVVATGSTPFDNLRLIGLPSESASPKMMVAVWWDDVLGRIWASRLNATTGALIDAVPVQLDATSNTLLPVVTPLSDNRSFFAYYRDGFNVIKANDFDSNLTIEVGSGITMTGTTPIPAGAVQFGADGNILFVYMDKNQSNKFTIKYTLFNKTVDSQLIDPPEEFSIPYDLAPANISVALDNQGRAMVFWTDEVSRKYLFFALIDSGGNVITPPMIFRDAGPANNFIISPTGQGIVGLGGLHAEFLPLISR